MTANYEFLTLFVEIIRINSSVFSRRWLEDNESENVTRDRIELHLWIANHRAIIPTFAIEFASIASSYSAEWSVMRETTFAYSPTMLATSSSAHLSRSRRIRSGSVSSASTASCVVARKGVGILSRGRSGWKLIGARPKRARNGIRYHSKVSGRRGFASQGRINVCQRARSSNILDAVIAKMERIDLIEYWHDIICISCEYYLRII